MSGIDSTLEVNVMKIRSVLTNQDSETNGLYCTNQLNKY